MYVMKKGLFFTLVLSLFLFACSRPGTIEDEAIVQNNEDTTRPVVEVLRPIAGQQYRSGDSIIIEGKASDIGLHYGSIVLTNDANGMQLARKVFDLHLLSTYSFRFANPVQVTSAQNYTISIEFEDHSLNKTQKTIKVSALP
jgi:hypothetical protein